MHNGGERRGIFRLEGLLILVLSCLIVSYASAQEKRFNVPVDDSPSYGRSDAPVTIIEFIDYQ